jgi:hypothetical protein
VKRSEEEDSYMGYRLQGVRIVMRVEGSEGSLPTLDEGDILFYTLVNGLKATEEIKEMGPVRVKFFEGEGLKKIGDDFMKGCVTLKEVCFGKFNSLKSIGNRMFSRCTSLKTVSFRGLEDVKSIGNTMFCGCTSLKTVSFEGLESVESIGDEMFSNCKSLKTVSFEGLNPKVQIKDEIYKGKFLP